MRSADSALTMQPLVVPVLKASHELPTGPLADTLATALGGAARDTVACTAELSTADVVVVDGLHAGLLTLAATAWRHSVPVLLVSLTPSAVRSAAGLLQAVGPGVAGRSILTAIAPSPARPDALAYALLQVTAELVAGVVPLPHLPSRPSHRHNESVLALAAAVRAVPAPRWPKQAFPGTYCVMQEAS